MTMITGAGPAQTQAQIVRLQKKLDKIENKLEVLIALASPPPPPQPAMLGWSPVYNELRTWLAGVNAWLQQFYAPAPAPAPGPAPGPAPAPTPGPAPAPLRWKPTDFVISSFNVLGSSHTKASGNKPDMRSGPARMPDAVKLLNDHKVDVVGFQEFQRDQMQAFKTITKGSWGTYPGESNSANAIAWRTDTWSLVKGDTFKVPYFNGNMKDMPVVRLRNKQSGQEIYVLNVHNPADTKKFHHQEAHRDRATAIEVALINKLQRESGLPIFFTGDLNERQEARDKVVGGTDLVAAEKTKKSQGIDWIFGSDGVQFSGYTRRRDALVKRTTDHPIVVTRARIPGKS